MERMADCGLTQMDFVRGSGYGQVLQAQQNLAKEMDELQQQLDVFIKQVEDL